MGWKQKKEARHERTNDMFMLRNGIIGKAGLSVLVTGLIPALLAAGLGVAATVATVPSDALPDEAAPPVVIENVRIFDGEELIAATRVVIKGGIIAGVGKDSPTSEGAELINGQDLTLLPGLIDAHVHIWAEDQLRQTLIFGVTSVVDMFMDSGTMKAIKEKQAATIDSKMATLISAGILATAPGGHGTEYGMNIPTVSGPEEAQAFVDARIAEGSDFIKIILDNGSLFNQSWATFDRETLEALIKAAHARDKLAVVHVTSLADARTAIEAGADALAHLYYDGGYDPGFGNLVASHRAFVIPTLSVIESMSGTSGASALIEDPHLSPFLNQADRAGLRATFGTVPELGRQGYEGAEKGLRQLKAAAVPILAGTDTPNPGTAYGASLHRELRLLVDAGMTPTEALRSATSLPAAKFGISDRGRIVEGARADLLLVKGNPTDDIMATRNIVGVWKDGVRIDREAYRKQVETEAAKLEEMHGAPPPPGSESGLISDFEAAEITSEFGFGWNVSTDEVKGGSSTAALTRIEGGAEDSQGAMLIKGNISEGSPYPWAGAFFSPGESFMAPANLSSESALSFWAKGDGKTYCVMLFAQSLGYMPSTKEFVAGPVWEHHSFTFEEFGIDGHDIMGIFLGAASKIGEFILEIDDVRLD
jgi:imidazolonepropionase-like amidohydrolase